MEQVRGFSHTGDLHVAVLMLAVDLVLRWEYTRLLIAELQPAFHPTRGVLRTLAIVTMRKRHDQSRSLEPLGFTRSNELVNDALSVVGEVTKLRFPHDKRVGRSQGVTILESEAKIAIIY